MVAFGIIAALWSGNSVAVFAAPPTAITASKESITVTLKFAPGQSAQSVFAAGTFNGWSKTATPLTKATDGKTWTVRLNLEPDVYQYKFVVNGETWLPDPNAPRFDDGNGNVNSLLTVAPAEFHEKPAKVGDGIITESALRHISDSHYVTRVDRTHFAITLRTRHDDVESAEIVIKNYATGMKLYRSDALFTYWRGVAPLPVSGSLRYRFVVGDGKTSVVYGANRAFIAKIAPQTHDFVFGFR